MKRSQTMKKWAIGVLAAMMVGASPWMASAHAQAADDAAEQAVAEKHAAILELCVQEVGDEDSEGAIIASLKEQMQGLSADELGDGLKAVIQAVTDEQRETAVERYVAAAIGMAEDTDELEVLAVAERLGAGMTEGVIGIEGLTNQQRQDRLSDIAIAASKAGINAALTGNRVGVRKKFAYGASISAQSDQQTSSTVAKSLGQKQGDDTEAYVPPLNDDPDTSPIN